MTPIRNLDALVTDLQGELHSPHAGCSPCCIETGIPSGKTTSRASSGIEIPAFSKALFVSRSIVPPSRGTRQMDPW